MVKIKEKLKNKANTRCWQHPVLATPGVVAKAVIAALIVVGFLGGITWAAGGWGFGSGSSSTTDVSVGTSADKGLIGYWPLDSASEKVGSELHDNWDMENGTASWSFDSKTDGSRASETSDYLYGAKSIRIKNSTVNHIAIWDPPSGQTIGTLYRVSVWAKNIDCPTVPYFSAAGATKISGNTSFTGISTTEWKYYSAIFEATATTPNIYIRTNNHATQGEFLIDNFSLKEIKTADATPYSHHGTVYGATQNDDDMTFDGTDDYVDIGDKIIQDNSSYTIAGWFYIEADGARGGIFQRRNEEPYNGVTLGKGSPNEVIASIEDVDGDIITLSLTQSLNNWVHYVATYDSSTHTLSGFVNGNLIDSGINTNIGTIELSTQTNLEIGRRDSTSTPNYFNGSIKDVRIYNRALSADEVASLYNGGTSGSKNLVIGSKSKGLIGQWKLDQGSEKVGSEMNPSIIWYNIGGWPYETLTDDDSGNVTFVNTTDYGMAYTNVILALNKTYRIVFTTGSGTYTSTQFHVTSNPGTLANALTRFDIAANTTYDITVTPVVTNGSNPLRLGLRTASGVASSGSIIAMSVKELKTGDATPSSNNGTIYGATYTTDRKGQTNKAMSFDGVDDYINAGNISQTNFGTGDFSISAWINTTDSQFYILGKQTWGVAEGFFLGTKAGYDGGDDNYFWFDTGYSSANAKILTSLINTGQWVHVVAVRSNGVGYIYVNNDLKVTDSSNSQNVDSNASLTIGRRTGGGYYLDGDLSDIRIYDRALSIDEIASLYNSYNPVVSTGSLQKGLVLDMPLDSKREKVGGETITNGDAEIGDVTGWSVQGGASRSSVISQLHSGTYSLQVTNSNTSGGLPYNFIYQQVNGLTIGATYRTVAWVKGATSSDTGYIGVSDDIVQGEASYYGSDGGPNHSDWTKLSVTFVPEATTVYVQLYSNSGANISYWDDISLKEIQTADTTTYSNHGVVYGATQNSDSMSFDGVDDYVDVGNEDVLKNLQNMTVGFWVKVMGSPADSYAGLVTKGYAPVGGNSWSFSMTKDRTGYFFVRKADDSGYTYPDSYEGSPHAWDVLPIGTWVHMVGVINSENYIALYRNGELHRYRTIDFAVPYNSSKDIMVGKHDTAGEYNFLGSISNVKIYNRALSADEVQLLYNKGR